MCMMTEYGIRSTPVIKRGGTYYVCEGKRGLLYLYTTGAVGTEVLSAVLREMGAKYKLRVHRKPHRYQQMFGGAQSREHSNWNDF